jgi:hypothetical protein
MPTEKVIRVRFGTRIGAMVDGGNASPRTSGTSERMEQSGAGKTGAAWKN